MAAINQAKMSSRFQDEWQKSLRNPSRPLPRRRSSISDIPSTMSNSRVNPVGIEKNKVRKLSVIEDLDESVFNDGGPERASSQVFNLKLIF